MRKRTAKRSRVKESAVQEAAVTKDDIKKLVRDFNNQSKIIRNLDKQNKYLRDRVSNLENRVNFLDRAVIQVKNAVDAISRILR